MPPSPSPGPLFLRHVSGALHMLSARKAATLRRELAAGRGGPEITKLLINGYAEFLGPDGEDWAIDALTADLIK